MDEKLKNENQAAPGLPVQETGADPNVKKAAQDARTGRGAADTEGVGGVIPDQDPRAEGKAPNAASLQGDNSKVTELNSAADGKETGGEKKRMNNEHGTARLNPDAEKAEREKSASLLTEDQKIKKNKRTRAALSFIIMAVLLIVLFFAAVNIGSLKVGFGELLRGLFVEYDDNVATIVDLRFPRIFISILAGAAVAVSGVLFQAVLKNPLADPGIIGISGGASFAAVIITSFFPMLYFFTPMFAFLGGMLAFALVYSLSWKGGLSPLRIILVGVAVSSMFSGLSSGLNSMSGGNLQGVAAIVNGNITMKTWSDVWTLLPYTAAGLVLSLFFCKTCNIMSLEDKTARSLGVNVDQMRIVISLIAVLLASISTAVAGAISFLGLIVPHIGRLLVGSDHKRLIPFSMLLGAFVFLLADTIGRTVAAPYEISASVIMNIIGGPFFIILLRRSTKYAAK